MMLPMVTGRRLPRRKDFHETAAPEKIASGMMNMLATECSSPSATNAEMGNQMATIFPAASRAKEAMYTAMQTSQLQRMPRATAVPKEREVLAAATLAREAEPARVPPFT